MRRWTDASSGPARGRRGPRAVSVQAGVAPDAGSGASVEAWLDTGLQGSRFEYTFTLHLGPWRFVFDWRPAG